ncbi:YdeI/OmpD-associated family protein [Roseivivax sp. CAU 1761]
MAADPRIDRYLAKDRPWRAEMAALRAICLSEGLDETLKWRAPCYMAAGRNIAMIGALRDAALLSFLSGALLDDSAGLLVPPGPNSRAARQARFTDSAQIAAAAPPLRQLIRQAVGHARAGRRVALPAEEPDLPAELAEALAADAELRAAWQALTPGRRRSLVLHIAGAAQAATRHARIARQRDRILAGRGLHDR